MTQDQDTNVKLKRKFDTKQQAEAANKIKPAKNNRWILFVALFAAVGLGIWYFTSANNTSKAADTPSDVNASKPNANSTGVASTAGDNTAATPAATTPGASTASSNDNSAANTNPNSTSNGTENGKQTGDNKVDKNGNVAASENSSAKNTANKSENANTSSNSNAKSRIKVVAYFNAGSSNIASSEEKEVNEIFNFLKKNPSEKITVNGYASSEGDLTVNQQLSQKRAEAFKNFLVKKGISTNRIETLGKGVQDPIASNETSDGRAKNRRVEVVR